MQSSEKLCLKWNDFQENLNSAFRGFRNDLDFADVTLACEDGTQIEAHKFVLASSGPFFMEILKRNKHPHPLIYMRGLKAEALVAMIDFLYNGEANVNQDSLDDFLGLADELKLKGLTKTEEGDNQEYQLKPPTKGDFEQKYDHTKSNLHEPQPLHEYKQNTKAEETLVALFSEDAQELDEQIKSMMSISENKTTVGKQTITAWACNVCGKEGHKANIKTHIEANHVTSNISHSCDICGKSSRSRDGLRQHKAKDHFQN